MNTVPTNACELITNTFQDYNELLMKNTPETFPNVLLKVLKKFHLWPSMKIKKFKDNDNLVLLHNTYKRDDINSFKELYDQCRSIVFDFTNSMNNVVVSYANNIPDRIKIEDYIYNPADKFQAAYDGTMITVYNYNNKWYFGTSSCPDINMSKFSNPSKSHGYMLDEILMTYFRNQFTNEELVECNLKVISDKLRNIFVSYLDPNYAYEFVMLHHENIHIIDYSDVINDEYKNLYHINTKNRSSLTEEDINHQPLAFIGIMYPIYFSCIQEACNYNTIPFSYGFIIKKYMENGNYKLYKISPHHIDIKEETDPCKPNVWHNILMVYMKNRKDYKIKDYITNYAIELVLPIDNKGIQIDPTYLIHTMIITLNDVLYNMYIATTTYNSKTKKYKMNKELDNQFPPVIRFHLAQMRYKQLNEYSKTIIRHKDVYHYLCHSNNVKNIKLLIAFLSTSVGYNITERSALCLTILNGLL